MDHGWLRWKSCVWKVPVFLKQSDECFVFQDLVCVGCATAGVLDIACPIHVLPTAVDTKIRNIQMQIKIVTISRCWSTFFLRCLWWRITVWPKMFNIQNGILKHPWKNLPAQIYHLSLSPGSMDTLAPCVWFPLLDPFGTLPCTHNCSIYTPEKSTAGTPKLEIWNDLERWFSFFIGWFLGSIG